MQALLELYRDPLFVRFPLMTSLISMLAFLLFATPFTIVSYLDPERLRRYRIQARRMPPEKVLWPSLVHWLRNNALLTGLVVLAWPLLRLSRIHDGPVPPAWVVAGEVLLFIYLDDFLYYWMHRAFHQGVLYDRVHSVHHRLYAPWACGGHYMHPLEYVATGSLMLVGPLLLGAHVVTVYAWVVFRQWEAAEGHSGYSFPWNPSHFFPGSGDTEFHDFHHARFHGNYAGFLGWVDGLFGTYSKGYLERMSDKKRAKAAERARP